jgi:hypothetical protein
MYVHQLNDIIKNNNELGEFMLGNLKIKVNSLEEHQHKLIRLWYSSFIIETTKIKRQLVV